MPEGLGYALGEGAEAFSGTFSSTRNYKIAIAQQQLQVSMQKERLAMDQQRQAMEMETMQQALDRSNIAEQVEKEALKDKIRKGELARESDKLINLSKVIGGFPKSEGAKADKKGAPKKGVFGQDISPERLLEAYDLAGRKAPLSLQKRVAESTITDYEQQLRDLGIESEESLIEQRTAAAEASRREGTVPSTQGERWVAKLLDPNVSQDEKNIIKQKFLGNKATVDGVPLIELERMARLLYPEFAGVRTGIPENIDPNSVAFLRHLATKFKEGQGGSPPPVDLGDEEITVDSLFN